MEKIKIIMDVDTGIDDAIAICLACGFHAILSIVRASLACEHHCLVICCGNIRYRWQNDQTTGTRPGWLIGRLISPQIRLPVF